MANTLTNLMRTWLAAGIPILRNNASLTSLVSRDFDMKPMEKGDRVKVPLPPTTSATAFTPSMTFPTPGNVSIDKVEIVLDQWYYTDFGITDLELTQIEAGEYFNNVVPVSRIAALADAVDAHIWTKVTGANGFFGYVGTAGTNPFASNSDILADASKVLTDNKAPRFDRHAIFNTAAVAAAKKLADFKDSDKMGDASVKRDGWLGRVGGFDTYEDQAVALHTTGAATAGTIALDDSVSRPIGTTTLHMDGFSVKPSPGDIFTIAGDTQTYRVTSSTTLAGTDSDVTFFPGLKVAIPAADGNEVVTFKASFRGNIAFQKGAIQLVTRPLAPAVAQMMGGMSGTQLLAQTSMTDEVTGISIRASAYRGFGMCAFYFDVLWGAEVVRPELGVIIAG